MKVREFLALIDSDEQEIFVIGNDGNEEAAFWGPVYEAPGYLLDMEMAYWKSGRHTVEIGVLDKKA